MLDTGKPLAKWYIFFVFLSFLHAQDAAGDLILKYIETQSKEATIAASSARLLKAHEKEEFENLINRVVARSLFEQKKEVGIEVLNRHEQTYLGKGIHHVYGTSFGVPGNKKESNLFKDGTRVRRGIVCAALPDSGAVGKWIEVRNVDKNNKRGKWVKILVRDLGPWFRDDPYWIRGQKPRAVEYFKKKKRRWDRRIVANPAGIDLTPWAWQKLGIPAKESMNHSGYVEWRFTKTKP